MVKMANKRSLLFISFVSAVLLFACARTPNPYVLPARHPAEDGADLRICTDCHEIDPGKIPFRDFNHTLSFAANHRQVGSRYAEVCNRCHRPGFCSDCHGLGVELTPSVKNPEDPSRRMPHRGDYLARHMVDGRVNPASCYRCHGNPKSSFSCKKCHGG